jgi:hypothetical protein
MFKRFDESPFFIRLLQRLSTLLAKQRGLPIVIGIVLIALGFIVQLINLFINSPTLDFIQIVLHNVGIILSLVGVLLAQPLGN